MISALGSSRRTSAITRSPVPLPAAGFTTTTRPAPSGRGGVSMRSGSAFGRCCSTIGRDQTPTQRGDGRANTEACQHVTLDGAPVATRESPTRPASTASTSPSVGFSSPTPTANAAALAE